MVMANQDFIQHILETGTSYIESQLLFLLTCMKPNVNLRMALMLCCFSIWVQLSPHNYSSVEKQFFRVGL